MINVLILVILVKINLECKNPWWPTGIYAGIVFILSILLGFSIWAILLGLVINLGLGYLYFWLQKKFEGEGSNWWAIVIFGLLLFLGIGFI